MQRWNKMQFYLVCRTPWSAYIWYDKCVEKKKEKKEKLRALGNFKNCTFRASFPLVRYFNSLLMSNSMIGLMRYHCYLFIVFLIYYMDIYILTLWGTPILARPCLGEPWACCPCFSFLWVFNPRNNLENVVFFLLVFCPCSVTTVERNELFKSKFSKQ